ncbi:hypothetical protein M514_03043 [Trichuris suis]|uniref:Uncharacterized protein n=1 Tax=Trichuris suis TaxID=68888 RepID=A0A085MFC3_9BILA|nr:hypothetical protein M513_03043 [Trichuris suis]KFD68322.1 hypothetical protein M514_03043 [Trichuris suis]
MGKAFQRRKTTEEWEDHPLQQARKLTLIRKLVEGDYRITIGRIGNAVGNSLDPAFASSCGLGLKMLSTCWISRALRDEQLIRKVSHFAGFWRRLMRMSLRFFDRTVAGYETWIYQYVPERPRWNNFDFLEREETVGESYYKAILQKLRRTLARKWQGKLRRGIMFYDDNT